MFNHMRNRTFKRGKHALFSLFLPTIFFGESFDAEAAPGRTWQPTQAQLRMEEQRRMREREIIAIRNRNASRIAAKTTETKVVAAAAKAETVPAPRLRYTWINSRCYVLLSDIAKFYRLTMAYTKNGIILRGSDKIDLFYNKRLGVCNGVNVYFTSPPVLRGNAAYLYEKDLLLVLDPLLRDNAPAKHPVKTIMIDPGHGGTDKGAPGAGNLLEKNLNLVMALKLRTALQKAGFRVVMTRSADSTLSLQGRADICKKYKPDLFISIHCNAAAQKNISGIETFAMTPNGCASTSDSKPGSATGPGNSFDKNNYRMAYEMQKALILTTGAEDRGVKHARFFVLRNASCPAVLIETGFITNPREGALLNRKDYQTKIVNAILAGIRKYQSLVK